MIVQLQHFFPLLIDILVINARNAFFPPNLLSSLLFFEPYYTYTLRYVKIAFASIIPKFPLGFLLSAAFFFFLRYRSLLYTNEMIIINLTFFFFFFCTVVLVDGSW